MHIQNLQSIMSCDLQCILHCKMYEVLFNLQLMHDVKNNVAYAVHSASHFNLQKTMHDTVQKKTMSTFYRKSVPSRNFVITQSVLSVAAAPRQIVINIYNISLLQSIMMMIDEFLCVCVEKPQICGGK